MFEFNQKVFFTAITSFNLSVDSLECVSMNNQDAK